MAVLLKSYLLWSACVLLMLQNVAGYQMFQEHIPNGEIVPHPCKANYVWHGVGHKNPLGGGERNPFGLAFYGAGKQWTKALCEMDSDGDGKTNGEELGDPYCVWYKGQTPSRKTGISHPGVCDPFNSAQCANKNRWVDCKLGEFECDAINNVDTQSLNIRLPETEVPAKETTYMCMLFDLPQNDDYHLIANRIILDNVNVMHHLIVYACNENEDGELDATVPVNQSYVCDMAPANGCTDIIGLWAVGIQGNCIHNNAGFRIGSKGYKRVAIEVHWNNPELVAGTTDRSGITLYYTPNLRPYNAGVLMVGQESLHIPPGESSVPITATCSGNCTRQLMKDRIYIFTASNHMHYLGKAGHLELFRNGKKVQNLADDPVYNYDSPKVYDFTKPLMVEPGDELRTTCVFKSTSRSKTTFFGLQTSDEMCYGFIMYYPKEYFESTRCVQWENLSTCDFSDTKLHGCQTDKYLDPTDPEQAEIYGKVMGNCDSTGLTCRKECKDIVKEVKQHPCFKDSVKKYMRSISLSEWNLSSDIKVYVADFYFALDSCDVELAKESVKPTYNYNCTRSNDGTVVCSDAALNRSIQTLVLTFAFIIWKLF